MVDPLPIELNIHGGPFNSKNIAKIRLNSIKFSHFLHISINYSDMVLLFGKIHIAHTSLDDLQVGKSITRTSFIFLHARLLYHCDGVLFLGPFIQTQNYDLVTLLVN